MRLAYEVWDTALQFLAVGKEVNLSELPFTRNEQLSAKRTLRDMQELGWLTKVSDNPPVWEAGPVAQRCMALPQSSNRLIEESDWRNARDNTEPDDNRPASEILRELRTKVPRNHATSLDPISRDSPDSTPLNSCSNCGCELTSEETIYESHWFRYEGSNNAAGSGWATYCEDCSAPGML
jgi:hypothetical protein